MKLSYLAENQHYSAIPRITQFAQQFKHVEYYTTGEPDLPSPESVKQAVIQAILNNDTYYPDIQGDSTLRTIISQYYNAHYQTQLNHENIMITCGSTGALYLTLLTLISPNDEVILLTPHYSNYIGQIRNVGAKPVLVELNKNNNFLFDIHKLEQSITPKTKALLFNIPNNPLGTILNKQEILNIGQLAKKNGLFIISDEIYSRLVFDKSHTSFLLPEQANLENTFVIDGVSKSHSMTGYRIGFVITPHTRALHAMTELNDQIYGGVPNFIQKGVAAALTTEAQYSEKIKNEYAKRREQLYQGLKQIKNINCIFPNAAFYMFVNIKKSGLSSEEFVYKLIQEKQIVVVPGTNYGQAGEGFIRISYATTKDRINYFINEFSEFMKQFSMP